MACCLTTAARATLGASTATIAADGDKMSAVAVAVAMGSYTRHDLTRSNSGSVQEFANAAGQIFAVTWRGPGKPDLRALLGPAFTSLVPDQSAARDRHSLRQPVQVNQPDLQIQTGGHMGWFRGVAFIPSLAPPGFQLADLAFAQ